MGVAAVFLGARDVDARIAVRVGAGGGIAVSTGGVKISVVGTWLGEVALGIGEVGTLLALTPVRDELHPARMIRQAPVIAMRSTHKA